MRAVFRAGSCLVVMLLGCSSTATPTAVEDSGSSDVAVVVDAPVEVAVDAAPEAETAADPAAGCASTFGMALTSAFGRLDGVVTAIVPSANTTCPEGTSPTHVVLQVKSQGAVYRMVVNVQSDRGGPDIDSRFAIIHHAALSPWADGWHAPEMVDYFAQLGVHSDATFTATPKDALIAKLDAEIPIGAEVTVYATSSGGSSAHLIHRHAANDDGAIVVDPRGASPKWLLFHFVDQTF